jgi:alanine racemase
MVRSHKTWVEISKAAVENNLAVIRKFIGPDVKIAAVVKSNSYGHGLVEIAKLFSKYGADWFCVDNVDEAIVLRKKGIKNPILVLGFTHPSRFKDAVKNSLRLTLYNIPDKKTDYKKIPFHLKVDTGMSRQGVLLSELFGFLKKLPSDINIEGLSTHFANTDVYDRSYPKLQFNNFVVAGQVLENAGIKPAIRHACASAGLLTMPEAHFDMVRPGILLYGLWPSALLAGRFKQLGIKPALSWKTRVDQIKNIKQNTPVGYGITERVKKDTTIAVLPVGYYDGYDRGLSSVAEVLLDGVRCKVLGKVSMNLTVVDISNVKNPKIGDEVVLIGEQGKEKITAEEIAEKIGTIAYEIVTRITPLLQRLYL